LPTDGQYEIVAALSSQSDSQYHAGADPYGNCLWDAIVASTSLFGGMGPPAGSRGKAPGQRNFSNAK